MDWDPLELNDNGNGNSVIAAVDTKMSDLQAGVKQCERGRGKNVNDGECMHNFHFVFGSVMRANGSRCAGSAVIDQLRLL